MQHWQIHNIIHNINVWFNDLLLQQILIKTYKKMHAYDCTKDNVKQYSKKSDVNMFNTYSTTDVSTQVIAIIDNVNTV